jgi:hypothetical protein
VVVVVIALVVVFDVDFLVKIMLRAITMAVMIRQAVVANAIIIRIRYRLQRSFSLYDKSRKSDCFADKWYFSLGISLI